MIFKRIFCTLMTFTYNSETHTHTHTQQVAAFMANAPKSRWYQALSVCRSEVLRPRMCEVPNRL